MTVWLRTHLRSRFTYTGYLDSQLSQYRDRLSGHAPCWLSHELPDLMSEKHFHPASHQYPS